MGALTSFFLTKEALLTAQFPGIHAERSSQSRMAAGSCGPPEPMLASTSLFDSDGWCFFFTLLTFFVRSAYHVIPSAVGLFYALPIVCEEKESYSKVKVDRPLLLLIDCVGKREM